MKQLTILLSVVFLILFSIPAYAWDGSQQGSIARYEATDGNNRGFRVYLQGYPTLCAGGSNWAYVNESDSNYKTYVTALIAAKAQKNLVTLYTTTDATSYCHIGYIIVW